jgi:hypothetical protein
MEPTGTCRTCGDTCDDHMALCDAACKASSLAYREEEVEQETSKSTRPLTRRGKPLGGADSTPTRSTIMETIARTTPAPKAYFAQLDGDSGILMRPAQDVLFFNTETRQYIPITPANAIRVIVLKNVSEFMTQYYTDLAAARQEHRARHEVA